MIGDLFYSLGSWVGGLAAADDPVTGPDGGQDEHSGRSSDPAAADPAEDNGLLVNAILVGTATWAVGKLLRPKSVSWPRVVVAGIGATVLADLVSWALEPAGRERDRALEEDPDTLMIRLAAGVALAAGYASLLYPRLPGPPLVRGLAFGALEIVASPHGGLVRVASDTPGLKFPLKDLAVPLHDDGGPLSALTFGLVLGALYQPGHDETEE